MLPNTSNALGFIVHCIKPINRCNRAPTTSSPSCTIGLVIHGPINMPARGGGHDRSFITARTYVAPSPPRRLLAPSLFLTGTHLPTSTQDRPQKPTHPTPRENSNDVMNDVQSSAVTKRFQNRTKAVRQKPKGNSTFGSPLKKRSIYACGCVLAEQ